MKRLFSLSLAAIILFALLPLTVYAESDVLKFELSINESYYIVTCIDKNVEYVQIPYVYNGKPVKEIQTGAFYDCVNLKSIEIPNTITVIPAQAFYNCKSLTNFYIPYTITTIEYSAFGSCENLSEINIPDSVITIEHSAFSYCRSLKSIEIPNSLTNIGERAFHGCTELEKIIVAEDNKYYHSESNCLIETETNTLLLGCKNSIIPDYITSIAYYAFSECTFTDIKIPNSVTTIGEYAFSYCSDLVNIEIPDSVTTIKKYAFFHTGLKSINIPDSVTTIETLAFGRCSCLEEITVAENNKYYHSETNCIIETETNTLLLGCKNSIIPDYVSVIADGAFMGCPMETIQIPNSVTEIGYVAFAYCRSLIEIIIPDSVTTIGVCAFSECTSMTYVEIPNSVTTIEYAAFEYCNSLDYIEIPDSVTKMGSWVFDGCEFLYNIYCEAESKPENWDNEWVGYSPANAHWGDPGPQLTIGDIDASGELDADDYIMLKRVYFGTSNYIFRWLCDTNKDGNIDADDYILLKRAYFGAATIG